MILEDLLLKIEFRLPKNYRGFRVKEMLSIFGKNFQTFLLLQEVKKNKLLLKWRIKKCIE